MSMHNWRRLAEHVARLVDNQAGFERVVLQELSDVQDALKSIKDVLQDIEQRQAAREAFSAGYWKTDKDRIIYYAADGKAIFNYSLKPE